jgi:hypothetical protein
MAHSHAPLTLLSVEVNLKPIVRSKVGRNQLYLSGSCFEIRAYTAISHGESEETRRVSELRYIDIARTPFCTCPCFLLYTGLEMYHKLSNMFVIYQPNLKQKFSTNLPRSRKLFSHYVTEFYVMMLQISTVNKINLAVVC